MGIVPLRPYGYSVHFMGCPFLIVGTLLVRLHIYWTYIKNDMTFGFLVFGYFLLILVHLTFTKDEFQFYSNIIWRVTVADLTILT